MPGKARVGRLGAIETWRWSVQEPLMTPGSLPAEIPRLPQSYQQGFSPKLHKQTGIRRTPLPSLSYPKRITFSEWNLLSLNFLKLHITSQLLYSIPFLIGRHGICQHQEWFPSLSFYFCLYLDRNTVVWLWFLHVGGCGGWRSYVFCSLVISSSCLLLLPPSSPGSYFLQAWAIFSSDIRSNNSILFLYSYNTALGIW